MEPNSPKKIQFAVPLFQSHLDPQAAEHIRKRRPTPATLVIYNDPNASDDKQSASGQSETQLSPAQRKTSVYTPPTMRELQLVVEQHFQRHEQMEAGLSDSPDTPSPIAAQQPNGAEAQWASHSSSESYVSCDGQAGSSEEGGKDQSNKQRSGQEESPHLPKHTHSQLDTLSEEPTDRDAADQPSTTGTHTEAMKKLEAGFSSAFQEKEETFAEDQDTQEE
ncbi:protein phosphatase 1 regulatory subunit 1C isoform X1 [Hemibagrus wyckioides]|uniref:protein phosphatase 1 regulatory subunit 1C isoform X1 n=1 Tax=Hemibagrus wyckioides TaxID=337641 RepID=UPI00266BF18B|nr:protein phosphatase 1 regulatory subunit 1C isoform X1 [Hemibagrus wyckioides]